MSIKNIFIASAICLLPFGVDAANPLVSDMSQFVFPSNQPKRPTGFTYMPDGETYLMLSADNKSIIRYDIKTGEQVEIFLDLATTRETVIPDIDGFSISSDASKILVWRDSQSVYRRSFTANYYVYEVRSRLLRPLSTKFERQQTPIFSPDSRMVAFVSENNIYIKKLDYQTEVAVTDDGKINSVINGTSDWVYEEEFSTTCSMAWAPDNLTLCFVKYDESSVPTYDMQMYGGSCNGMKEYELYPHTWSYKYPVAGENNSVVTLHSYDVETRKTKDISLPDKRIEYIPMISYGQDEISLIVATLNRDQNHFEIYKVNPKSTVCKSIYTEDSESWVTSVSYENIYLGETEFIVNSWESGYHQLHKYNYNGVETGIISVENCDITDFYGRDEKGNYYYQVAAPNPLNRVIRCVDTKGRTTTISPEEGYSSAVFSPDMRYMMLQHSSITQQPMYTLNTSAGKLVRTIENNNTYRNRIGAKLCAREFFTMQSDGVTLNGYIIKPVDFSTSKKYPTIMFQYSGPESQQVLNKWQIDWQDAFAHAGYVVICVDGRGTGARGRDFCDIVYKNLGYYETIDQIAAANYAATLPYVDASRIGICGWSYGGYEALMAASAENAPYKAAVAIAPVTDWRFYDTVYAERFMRTPQQNEDGYYQSAPLTHATKLKCPLLLMYGTSDDNVHPSNTIEYVSRLQSAGILCDMLIFPNMNHSINYCNARAVVYAKMLDWFNKNL